MTGTPFPWRSFYQRLACGLVAPGLLTLIAAPASAQVAELAPVPTPTPALSVPAVPAVPAAPAAAPAAPLVLDLAAAKALALEQAPSVAAAKASLAAACARKQALDHLRVPTFLQRDLPVRRQQAAVGLQAAEAGVRVAELDAVYAARYAYVTYLYANTQLRHLDNSIEGLLELRRQIDDNIRRNTEGRTKGDNGKADNGKADEGKEQAPPRTDLRASIDLPRIDALLEGARMRRAEAEWGARRALSLLREALALPCDAPLLLKQQWLFEVAVELDCKQLIELALARRPEVVAAAVGVEVTGLEVAAQYRRRCLLTLRTFASASDIHAIPLPATRADDGYRPGTLAPEMPVTINGRRDDRVSQAAIYKDRAATVLHKTRNLVQLQTEQAYLRYREAQARLAHLDRAADLAMRSQKRAAVRYFMPDAMDWSLTQLLATGQLATETRAGSYEARYRLLLALIDLEHHTAAGFLAGLDAAPSILPPSSVLPSEAEKKEIRASLEKEEGKEPKINGKDKDVSVETPTVPMLRLNP